MKQKSMADKQFSNLTTTEELIQYLKAGTRLNGVYYLSKYTSLSTVIEMFKSGLMLINNPRHMNDLYEYHSYSGQVDWDKICFMSFIAQKAENMAMWSMYAQPWEQGVMLTVPTAAIKKLVSDTTHLVSTIYDEKTNRYRIGESIGIDEGDLSLTRVAYASEGVLTCTNRNERNTRFDSPYDIPEFAGYIKDVAWDYEREVRLRVDFPDSYSGDAAFIEVSDDFLKQVKITTGPRFEGNVLRMIPERLRTKVRIEPSKFSERIAWIPCDNCKYKKKRMKE